MSAPGEQHEAARLSRIWDDLVAGTPSKRADDAALLAEILLLKQVTQVPAPPPNMKVRLWGDLMQQVPPLATVVVMPDKTSNGHHPERDIPAPTVVQSRNTTILLAASRWIAIGVISGFAAGFVAGLWVRIAMRLAGILTVERNRGLLTENDALVGQLTIEGTVSLAIFGAMIGVAGGLVYIATRRWLPRSGWLRALGFGVLLLAVLGFVIMDPGNPDYRRFGPAWFNVLTFSLAYLICGAGISLVADFLDRRIPPLGWRTDRRGRPFAWLVVLTPFTVIGVLAIMSALVNLITIPMGRIMLIPLVLLFAWRVAARWFDDADLRRRGSLLLRNVALLAPAAVGFFLTVRAVFTILTG